MRRHMGQILAQVLTILKALFFLPGMVTSLDNDAESRRMTQGILSSQFSVKLRPAVI